MVRVTEWKDFVPAMAEGKLALTPFCNDEEATTYEELVKTKDDTIAAIQPELRMFRAAAKGADGKDEL